MFIFDILYLYYLMDASSKVKFQPLGTYDILNREYLRISDNTCMIRLFSKTCSFLRHVIFIYLFYRKTFLQIFCRSGHTDPDEVTCLH